VTVGATDPGLIAMFDRQSAEFFRVARRRRWADIHVDDDVVWGTTGIPLATFNGATSATFTAASADDRIDTVLQVFRDRKVSMTWWVGPTSTPVDLVDRLVDHGLALDEVIPGLARSIEGWVPPVVDGVETELVSDDDSFQLAVEVMFAGFEMPEAIMPGFVERYRDFCIGPEAINRLFIARLGGRAVALALGFSMDGVVGVYNVATVPDARRRGAGSAATAAAMADARARGAHTAILESSAIGLSLYERLGFRQVCEVTILAGLFGE
jgi:ribosomal protein S18 acetylase RimI-like enzyme